jgi:hypothetical protein
MESFKEMPPARVKNSEVNEIKNIKYKTAAILKNTENSNINNLDLFLENERSVNQNEPWNKLDKTTKYKKISDYIEVYKTEKSLTEKETEELQVFLKDAIDKKKIHKVKDIAYDKVNGVIKEIPGLVFLKSEHKNFTLKNMNTKMSTLKALPKK